MITHTPRIFFSGRIKFLRMSPAARRAAGRACHVRNAGIMSAAPYTPSRRRIQKFRIRPGSRERSGPVEPGRDREGGQTIVVKNLGKRHLVGSGLPVSKCWADSGTVCGGGLSAGACRTGGFFADTGRARASRDGLSGERVSVWRFAEGKPDYAPLSNGKDLRSVQIM